MLAGREPQAEGRRLEGAQGARVSARGWGAPSRGVPAALLGTRAAPLSGGPDPAVIVTTKKTPTFLSPLPAIVHWKFAEHSLGGSQGGCRSCRCFPTVLSPACFLPPTYLLVFGATGRPGVAGGQFAPVRFSSPRDA